MHSDSGGPPPNTIWSKQMAHSLQWLNTFFQDEPGHIARTFTLDEFCNRGPCWGISTDASPWGTGGWLSCDGSIKCYFDGGVSQADLGLYDIQRGSCTGQQTLEGLAILVAMRLGANREDARSIRLSVRADNVGALMLLVKMRPSSPEQAIVARVLALITSKTAFPPRVVHTPGIAHKLADGLSRRHDLGHVDNILAHPALAEAVRDEVPARPREWY